MVPRYNFVIQICTLLSEKHNNICVVGDNPRGYMRRANIKNIQSFESDFKNVTVVKLEQNYRSTKNVIRAAWG